MRRSLTLYKGGEEFVFGYEPGQEDGVREVFREYVNNGEIDFDDFDAFLLGMKL